MRDTLVDLNAQYRRITGNDAYLYASSPGGGEGTRYVFATSPRPQIGEGAALTHMRDVLSKAQSGMTHDEIMFGRVRSN